jgi:hypothetical protein
MAGSLIECSMSSNSALLNKLAYSPVSRRAPVSTFRIRAEQAQVRDEVLLVVDSQHGIGGRGIGDIGIERRRLHGSSRNMSRTEEMFSTRAN